MRKLNDLYEWKTYHIKVDVVKETENCKLYSRMEDYSKCILSNDVMPLFEEWGCLPEYMLQSLNYQGLPACTGFLNMSIETSNIWRNAMEDVLNSRPLRLFKSKCPDPCNHLVFESTLATKRANREVSIPKFVTITNVYLVLLLYIFL